jgi:hypothetical protein
MSSSELVRQPIDDRPQVAVTSRQDLTSNLHSDCGRPHPTTACVFDLFIVIHDV